jgi:uncharacterized protein
VNDFARVFSEDDASSLEQLLGDTEKQTSAEIAVVTVASLDGMTIEEYANRLFKEWGIGKKAADNGVLVLVAPSERRARIEVGYGLEPILPDGLAGEIIRTQFVPEFRRGDYAAGIRAGVVRIIAIVRRDPSSVAATTPRANNRDNRPPALFVIPFLGAFVSLGGFAAGLGVRNKVYGALLFSALFAGIPLLIGLLVTFGLTLAVLVPLLFAMIMLGYRKGAGSVWRQRLRGRSASRDSDAGSAWILGSTGSDSSSSGSSSDSGSSDSSFGGGESGGGGASGSW